MDDTEFRLMEMTLETSGMPTYCDLLMALLNILEPPLDQEWDDRQKYLLHHIAIARKHITTAFQKQRIAQINADLLKIRLKNQHDGKAG